MLRRLLVLLFCLSFLLSYVESCPRGLEWLPLSVVNSRVEPSVLLPLSLRLLRVLLPSRTTTLDFHSLVIIFKKRKKRKKEKGRRIVILGNILFVRLVTVRGFLFFSPGVTAEERQFLIPFFFKQEKKNLLLLRILE